jgi:hypothetical protein
MASTIDLGDASAAQHTITAIYSGDGANLRSTATSLNRSSTLSATKTTALSQSGASLTVSALAPGGEFQRDGHPVRQ